MAAALDIADGEGLEALTVRGVARRCDVSPMAIYRHVETVEGLEDLAFRKAMRNTYAPTLRGPWRADVEAIWMAFRDVMEAHPGAAAIFARRAVPTPEIVAATNRLFEVLEKAGFAPQAAFDVYDTTFAFTLGTIRFDLTRDREARSRLLDADGAADNALSRHGAFLISRDTRRQFRRGLAAILDGYAGEQ